MEAACFGGSEPDAIWRQVSELVERHTGAEPVAVTHYSVSIGAVLGLVLTDGRRVAVKVFAPWHDPAFLVAANNVRSALLAEGYPAPAPLAAGVEPFGRGHAWIEEWLDAPPPRRSHDVVESLARHLADHLGRCARLDPDPALRRSWQTFEHPIGIWRNPPRPDADLDVAVPGHDWVRTLAERGRAVADLAPGPRMIGHVDWRPDNVRIRRSDDRLAAVFDWDSVQLTHRVHMLGGACSSLSPEDLGRFLDEFAAHVDDPPSSDERRAVAGRVIWSRATWAQFELVRGLGEEEQRFVPTLGRDVDRYLDAAS